VLAAQVGPKRTLRTTSRKAGLTRSAVACAESTVHTASPAVVMASTLVPVDSVRITRAFLGSICEMSSSSRLATQTPPAPAEMSPGRAPTDT
jgi:hypothetical protein